MKSDKTLTRAQATRQYRYLKRVERMMKRDLFNVYFLTFTFTDKMLAETSEQTRLRYIKEWLNQQASEYMLNKDYGDKHQREHYHALIVSRYKVIVTDTPLRHNVFIKPKKITYTLNDHYKSDKLISDTFRYSLKSAENLTAHAFKDSTKNSRIIYSKPNTKIKIDERFKALADAKLKAYRESAEGRANKELFAIKLKRDKQAEKDFLKLAQEIDDMTILSADDYDN